MDWDRRIISFLILFIFALEPANVIAADNPTVKTIDAILPLNLKQYTAAIEEEKKFAGLVRDARNKSSRDPLLYQAYQAERELRVNPNDQAANQILCDAYFKTGFLAASAKQCREVLKINPQNPLAKTHIADIAFRRGQAAAAESLLQETLRESPQFSAANILLAEIAKSRGQPEAARTQLDQAIATNPNEASFLAMGDAMLQDQQYDQAANSYLKVLQLNPDNVSALSRLADIYGGRGDYARALDFAQKAAATDPRSALAQYTLGTQYARANRLDEAVVSFAQSVKLDPEFALAHRALGDALIKKSSPVDAITALNKALQLLPGDAQTQTLLARAYEMTGSQAPATAPRAQATNKSSPLLAAARQAESQGQLEQARQTYEKLAIAQPENAGHFYNIGRIYTHAQQWDLAERFYTLAIERDPNLAPALGGLAKIRCYKGDAQSAWQNYSRAKQSGFVDTGGQTQQYLTANCNIPNPAL